MPVPFSSWLDFLMTAGWRRPSQLLGGETRTRWMHSDATSLLTSSQQFQIASTCFSVTSCGITLLSLHYNEPLAKANQTLQTIQAARQMSKEVTEKQLKPAIKAAVQQVEVAASNSRDSLQDATIKTAQDFNQCGDRMFQCAARALCLPNDVNATCGSTRNLHRGSKRRDRGSDRSRSSRSRSSRSRSSKSSDRRRRHQSSSRRHNREYSEDSTYEDI